jgi:hypothetical protein
MPLKGFPRGHKALVQEGYEFLFTGICREPECGATILWYRTPRRKRMPIDAERKIPHFVCCKAMERERENRRRVAETSPQMELFPF